jgi:hypothetical protein
MNLSFVKMMMMMMHPRPFGSMLRYRCLPTLLMIKAVTHLLSYRSVSARLYRHWLAGTDAMAGKHTRRFSPLADSILVTQCTLGHGLFELPTGDWGLFCGTISSMQSIHFARTRMETRNQKSKAFIDCFVQLRCGFVLDTTMHLF